MLVGFFLTFLRPRNNKQGNYCANKKPHNKVGFLGTEMNLWKRITKGSKSVANVEWMTTPALHNQVASSLYVTLHCKHSQENSLIKVAQGLVAQPSIAGLTE